VSLLSFFLLCLSLALCGYVRFYDVFSRFLFTIQFIDTSTSFLRLFLHKPCADSFEQCLLVSKESRDPARMVLALWEIAVSFICVTSAGRKLIWADK
jgi:hypothetical protein